MSLVINEVLVELEDYELKEPIGKGGFGVVFRAIEKKTGKEVALKVLLQTETIKTAKDQASILREISVPCILNLPGIVKMLGFRFPLTKEVKDEILKKKPETLKTSITEKGKKIDVDLSGSIIITELMKNGSLDSLISDYLKKGGKDSIINPTIRSKIIFGVAATMKRVHRSKVIHRDLKLENVFMDDKLEPRIADFGLAKVVENSVDMTMAIGTPYIMAPEIFMDEPYDMPVDVYAFAFLIYKMFTNTIEFADKKPIRSPQQFMMKIGRGTRPKKPESIPDVYWELVQNCWKQEPKQRLTFEEITEELKKDVYAIEEFGMKTDLEQLHEYQTRIDTDEAQPDLTGSTIKFYTEESIPKVDENEKNEHNNSIQIPFDNHTDQNNEISISTANQIPTTNNKSSWDIFTENATPYTDDEDVKHAPHSLRSTHNQKPISQKEKNRLIPEIEDQFCDLMTHISKGLAKTNEGEE